MTPSIRRCPIEGLFVIVPKRFHDARGYFSETWNAQDWSKAGLDLPDFVQDNHSLSIAAGTLRGLHFQAPPFAQGKLVRCARGRILDVAVDARIGSPTYGNWHCEELSQENGAQLWIPPGFLHGFLTREAMSEVVYKCSAPYHAECEGGIRWDSLPIEWGIAAPLLSPKDAAAPAFAEFVSPFRFEASA